VRQVNIHEAKTHLSQLVEDAARGDEIIIAKAGDMAYEIGTYHLTLNDAQGKPAASVGKYVVNWQKRGGQWKVVADIFNADK